MGYTQYSFSFRATANGAYYAIIRRIADGYVLTGPGTFQSYDEAASTAVSWSDSVYPCTGQGGLFYGGNVPLQDVPAGTACNVCIYKIADIDAGQRPTDLLVGAIKVPKWGITGTTCGQLGDDPVDHNTGGTDAMRVVINGEGVDGVVIRAYLTSEYEADASIAPIRGQAMTLADGRWDRPIYRDPTLAYTFTFNAAAGYLIETRNLDAVEED